MSTLAIVIPRKEARRTEYHLVAFFPHLRDKRLAGVHNTGKPAGYGVMIESAIVTFLRSETPSFSATYRTLMSL